MLKISLTFLIFLLRGNFIHARLTGIIQTDKGPVRGEIVKTVQYSSIEYSAFRAIPYAKPPIGQRRFQPPVPIDAWTEILNATSEPPSCPQVNENGTFYGNEDCLYLNVYSPKLMTEAEKAADEELLAVMVWIYGGSFILGDINSKRYGPDFLIPDNVVIVDMNYRIGALGFLSLDIDGATGNMGLKDQVLALKWVKKNIKSFGGDPKKVTIFGESAGSGSVSLHLISPASRGLFRAAIAMSGTALDPWAFATKSKAEKQAHDLAKKLGFLSSNKKQLLEEFRNASAEQMVLALKKVQKNAQFPPVMPTYEDPKKAKDVFLTRCASEYYETGDYAKIPIIMGFTNLEILSFSIPFPVLLSTINFGMKYAASLGDTCLPFLSNSQAIINGSVKDTKKLDKNLLRSAIKEMTDLLFIAGIDATQKNLARSAQPIFYYQYSFDYENSPHRLKGLDIRGSGHGEDLSSIFFDTSSKQSLDPQSQIGIQEKMMVRLWTNFAKYTNPTPNGTADPLLNVTWVPSGPTGLQLEIGKNKLEMGPRITNAFVERIQSLSPALEKKLCGSQT